MTRMCRMAGYLGPEKELTSLVDWPPHSLHQQSYDARELETSVVSADGWGAAWYLPGQSSPCLYRSTLPIWGDTNRLDLGKTVKSRCLLAAVRSATDPLSIAALNTQPFRRERLSFLHNGYIERFRHTLRRHVSERLSDAALGNISGDTDSEHLFALIGDAWESSSSEQRLVVAVRSALEELLSLARERQLKALLTLLVSDGERLLAARAAHGANSPTLYVKHSQGSGEVWFASEPLDREDTAWQLVCDRSLVVASPSGVEQLPLSGP